MSMLFELVAVLSDAELKQLERLPLEGKEAQLLQYGVQHRHEKEKWEAVSTAVKISPAYLRKAQSVLLRKLYGHLVPAEGVALLQFIAEKKTLVQHLLNEIKRQEAALSNNKDERANFYHLAIKYLLLLPYAYIPKPQVEVLRKKLQALLKDSPLGYYHVFIGGYQLYFQFVSLANELKLFVEPHRSQIYKAAYALEKLAQQTNSARALAEVYGNIIRIFKFLGEAEEEKYVLLAYDLCSDAANDVAPDMRLQLLLRHAEYLYHFKSDFVAAHRQYQSLIAQHGTALVGGYHLVAYHELCLLNNQLDEVPQLLATIFGPHRQTGEGVMNTSALMNYAKYYLCAGKLPEAHAAIRQAFQSVNKNQNRMQEIQIRNLENSCFMLEGDYDTALQLAERNIKYIHSKHLKLEDANFAHYYLLIKAIIELNQTGEPLSAKHQAMFSEWQKGNYNVYGLLLRRMVKGQ